LADADIGSSYNFEFTSSSSAAAAAAAAAAVASAPTLAFNFSGGRAAGDNFCHSANTFTPLFPQSNPIASLSTSDSAAHMSSFADFGHIGWMQTASTGASVSAMAMSESELASGQCGGADADIAWFGLGTGGNRSCAGGAGTGTGIGSIATGEDCMNVSRPGVTPHIDAAFEQRLQQQQQLQFQQQYHQQQHDHVSFTPLSPSKQHSPRLFDYSNSENIFSVANNNNNNNNNNYGGLPRPAAAVVVVGGALDRSSTGPHVISQNFQPLQTHFSDDTHKVNNAGFVSGFNPSYNNSLSAVPSVHISDVPHQNPFSVRASSNPTLHVSCYPQSNPNLTSFNGDQQLNTYSSPRSISVSPNAVELTRSL